MLNIKLSKLPDLLGGRGSGAKRHDGSQ